MKAIHILALGCLPAIAAGAARAQSVDRVDSLSVSMQAQIGNTVEIQCVGPTAIPFTPVSGSTKTLKCGDSVTIAVGRRDSYLVRTENGSTGYVEAKLLPTDPCVQTRYRSTQFRKQWVPKVGSMSKDEFWKFKNELYLQVTPDDVAVAYKCLNSAMDEEQSLGGMAGYANTVAFDLGGSGRSSSGPDAKNKLMKFTEALESQVVALALLDNASTAQTFAYAERHDGLLARYNALVDKHNNFIDFMGQRLHQLDSTAPAAAPGDTSGWRGILDGTLQGLAAFTPPKHLVCAKSVEESQYGDPVQPGFIYLNANPGSSADCAEK
jgi:hypothetical protein